MKKHKLTLLPIIICLILFSAIGCEKKEENQKPKISFLQPDSNLIVSKDTLITFLVEPFDADGTIDRVEFLNNGTLVHTITESPWKYDWSISSEENTGITAIKATVYDNHEASGDAETQVEVKSYLSKWVSSYEGTSHAWIGSPQMINGEYQYVTNHYYNSVLAEVMLSSQDSCLDFTFTYDGTQVYNNYGLKFLPSGTHYSSWGGGSGYGYLNIKFENDSMNYVRFQKCGIPCNSGTDFVIGKK